MLSRGKQMRKNMFGKSRKFHDALCDSDDIQLQQLGEMLKMQMELDTDIIAAKEMPEYPIYSIRLALIVEVCEMLQEMPTVFKYWKDSAVDNREKALEEYVDVIHFALSLTNYAGELRAAIKDTKLLQSIYGYDSIRIGSEQRTTYNVYNEINYLISTLAYRRMLLPVFRLGRILGFTWNEIYDGYMNKNKINHERLNCGY